MTAGSIWVTVAEAVGGGAGIQGFLAFYRRRSELRSIDRQTDSVVVETVERVVKLLNSELDRAKASLREQAEESARRLREAERQVEGLQRKVTVLEAQVRDLLAQLSGFSAGSSPA